MLNACPHCARQYDVSFLAAGAPVRCACGERFEVERREPRSPRCLRCTNCGGTLADAAARCEWCNAQVSLDERRLDAVCPGCFARAASGAKHCMECGLAFAPQALRALDERRACPRCAGALRLRELGGAQLVECGGCAGLWLDASQFEALCEREEQRELALRALGMREPPERPVDSSPVRYLRCPHCDQPMQRRNFGQRSGVIVDVCKPHGLWLDHLELERALAFARAGGLERARQRELERVRQARPTSAGVPPGMAVGADLLAGAAGSEVELVVDVARGLHALWREIGRSTGWWSGGGPGLSR